MASLALKSITCYLCGNKKLSRVRGEVRHGIKRAVYQCQRCSLVQLAPKKENLNEYYRGDYRKKFTPILGKRSPSQELFDLYTPYQGERLKAFAPYIKKHFRILEIGASAGQFLGAVKPLVREAQGLELNIENAAFMRRKLKIKVYTDPLEEDTLPENYFDTIFILETLEHIPDPVSFLKHAVRALKPGGHIVVEVPNIDDVEVSMYNLTEFNDFYYREPHIYYFSPKTIKAVGKRAGLTGKTYFHQFVNPTTHLTTMFAGKLAPSVADCWSPSSLRYHPLHKHQKGGIGVATLPSYRKNKQALDQWIAGVDQSYKALLKKLGIADTLIFAAKKR